MVCARSSVLEKSSSASASPLSARTPTTATFLHRIEAPGDCFGAERAFEDVERAARTLVEHLFAHAQSARNRENHALGKPALDQLDPFPYRIPAPVAEQLEEHANAALALNEFEIRGANAHAGQ